MQFAADENKFTPSTFSCGNKANARKYERKTAMDCWATQLCKEVLLDLNE